MEDTEALNQLRANWRLTIEGDGGHCPCCDRWGKIYRRALNASMARALVWLVQQPGRGDGWVHVPDNAPPWLLRSNQLGTLHLWGLVTSLTEEKTKLASSGLWQATERGFQFAHNRLLVPKYAYVYNNEVVEFEGEDVNVVACLGEKYSYQSLMANFDGSVYGEDRIFDDGSYHGDDS